MEKIITILTVALFIFAPYANGDEHAQSVIIKHQEVKKMASDDIYCLLHSTDKKCAGTPWKKATSGNVDLSIPAISKPFNLDRLLATDTKFKPIDYGLVGAVVIKNPVYGALTYAACGYFVPKGGDSSVVYKDETTTCTIGATLMVYSKNILDHNFNGVNTLSPDKIIHFGYGALGGALCRTYFTSTWKCIGLGFLAVAAESLYDNKRRDIHDDFAGMLGIISGVKLAEFNNKF